MDLHDALEHLGEPDPRAVERVWSRFERSRTRSPLPRLALFAGSGLALAAAAAGLAFFLVTGPEQERELQLESFAPEDHVWSEQVVIHADGRGHVRGTDRDVQIDWLSGRVLVEVAPQTGTELQVVTDEALVEVVGTVFSVDRDALGVKVGVEKGRVRVTCKDGWTGEVTPQTGPHACLPVTAAGLLGRADALIDAGAPEAPVLDTLDRGLALASHQGPVRGELLVRRMRQRAPLDVEGALQDAEHYLALEAGDRGVEVQRFAAWLALSERGCERALPWLTALHEAGSAEDSVLLAECVAPQDPRRARRLLLGALPVLDGEWSARASRDLAALLETRP